MSEIITEKNIDSDIQRVKEYLIKEYKGLFTPKGIEIILGIEKPIDLSTFYRVVSGEYGKSTRHQIYRRTWEDLKGEYTMTELVEILNIITL
jgi:hypothetical protein